MFAHNGVVGGLDLLDDRLRTEGASELVGGQTDSERVFALISAAARRNGGDVTAAIGEAVGWVGDNLPVYALNILLSTATDMWALRYPDSHELYMLDRRDPKASPAGGFDLQTERIHARSAHLGEFGSVVFATEPMDTDPGWRLLDPGELVHVDADLDITHRVEFPDPPAHLLSPAGLSPTAQQPAGGSAADHLPRPHSEQ
jgi:glutamine amidotransferase